MSIILIREPLSAQEIGQLQEEFPQFSYYIFPESEPVPAEVWEKTEVLLGRHLKCEELDQANRLRWIHVPCTELEKLCLRNIFETTNIVVSHTKSSEAKYAGEYAASVIFAFAKGLFLWHELTEPTQEQWDNRQRELVWGLKGKTLLQIGLDAVGSEVVQMTHKMGLRNWGVNEPASFHPACDAVHPYSELHSLIPAADIICIAAPRGQRPKMTLKRPQLELIKKGAILVVIGSDLIDETALLPLLRTGHLRGAAIDGELSSKIKDWPVPNLLLTPSIAELPSDEARLNFSIFIYNLRRFINNDFEGMKNGVQSSTESAR